MSGGSGHFQRFLSAISFSERFIFSTATKYAVPNILGVLLTDLILAPTRATVLIRRWSAPDGGADGGAVQARTIGLDVGLLNVTGKGYPNLAFLGGRAR